MIYPLLFTFREGKQNLSILQQGLHVMLSFNLARGSVAGVINTLLNLQGETENKVTCYTGLQVNFFIVVLKMVLCNWLKLQFCLTLIEIVQRWQLCIQWGYYPLYSLGEFRNLHLKSGPCFFLKSCFWFIVSDLYKSVYWTSVRLGKFPF